MKWRCSAPGKGGIVELIGMYNSADFSCPVRFEGQKMRSVFGSPIIIDRAEGIDFAHPYRNCLWPEGSDGPNYRVVLNIDSKKMWYLEIVEVDLAPSLIDRWIKYWFDELEHKRLPREYDAWKALPENNPMYPLDNIINAINSRPAIVPHKRHNILDEINEPRQFGGGDQ